VRCHLAQDFDDLEVIVADNASTDGTLEICRGIAAADPRVSILTSEHNRGAAPNFNRLVDAAKGAYFKWAAHDDWFSPDFISATLGALEADPKAIMSYAPMGVEDDSGAIFRWKDQILPDLRSDDPRCRYREMLWRLGDPTQLIFGLMRTDVLRRTGLIPNTPEPDRVLLNELALHGPILHVPGPTFAHYGPAGHMQHYADDRTPLKRRSWVWLHADNASRPKWATYRILQEGFASLARASHLGRLDRLLLTKELCSALLVRKSRSKVRRTFRRLHSPS
jgi:glycosyltransferase involved in cell wall biosynthesis